MQKFHNPGKRSSVLLFSLLGCLYLSLFSVSHLFAQINSASQAAQQRSKIILQSSERTRYVAKTNVSYLRNPVFRHENAILTCDSAVFYVDRNYFEAYENVHINQADTINIYSDKLNYDGNAKIAYLRERVRMVDKTSVLTTDILDYNMVSKIGTYIEGGKIVSKDANITSKNGFYFANSRDAYFRYNVIVKTEQSTIKSDTLRYNTLTNWAYFYGPTNIKEKDGGNLYTENGAYNTSTTYAYFGKKNKYTSGSRSLKGDSLYYDGKAGYGKAVKNIIFKDTADRTDLRGQLAHYYKADQRVVVTKNAYLGMGTNDSILVNNVKQPDSLWMGADTLETQMVLQKNLKLLMGPVIKKDNELGEEERDSEQSLVRPQESSDEERYSGKTGKPAATGSPKTPAKANVPDSLNKKTPDTVGKKPLDSLAKKLQLSPPKQLGLKKPVLKDSLPTSPLDTMRTRIIKAFHHVRVYKSNMQATADSLFYTAADSTLRWFKNPIIWSQSSQQTGDTIYVQLRNKKVNSIQVLQNAFVVNVEKDSLKFNQVKGKMITGFFNDGKLNSMYVDGNAESVYFTKTDDGKKYDKMNQTISSRIKVIFKNNDIQDVVPIKDVEGATVPVADLKEDVILTGFIWKPELRPRSKKDITTYKSPVKAKAAKTKTAVNTKPAGKSPANTKSTTAQKAPLKPAAPLKVNSDGTKQLLPAKTTISQDSLKKAPINLKLTDSLLRQQGIPAKSSSKKL